MAAPTGSYQVSSSPKNIIPAITATMGVTNVTEEAIALPASRII